MVHAACIFGQVPVADSKTYLGAWQVGELGFDQ